MMKKLPVTIAMLLFVTLGALAQGVTTASINGVIKDSKGEVLPGATVIAVHTPTGSQYGTASREDGRFIIPNARVGGPYKVTVSFVGYDNQEKNEIYLSLGNASTVDFALAESGTQLNEVTVVSSKNDVFSSERTGASTNISNREITRLPTISRSFNDYVRLTPQANANSFGGRSDGYNNITVDGALFNNAFGLSGTIGGQANAQPISLDAVDQITTSLAPYDVKEGSFTGAGINVVTRSGSNDFSGSVYYFARNQNLAGKKVSGVKNPLNNFDFNNIGFRIGGPIIKNKLFFFVNYERERRNDPGTQFSATRNGSSGSTVSAVSAGALDTLRTFLKENYQYDPGPYEGYKLQSNSDKGTVKIDWNISDQHKFTIKYNFLNSYRDAAPSNSGSLGGTRNPSTTGLPFLGAYYRINNNLNSVIAELNSSFGTRFSNKLQVGYTAMRDFRETPTASKLFPLVDIGNGSGSFSTAFGYEPFSAYNLLNSNVLQLSDNFDIYKGKHTLTLGTYNEFYKFENGFNAFYYGAYQFNSLADFYSSASGTIGAVKQYQLGYSTAADGHFPLVPVNAYQLGFYAQDRFDVTQNFNVTYGIRADIPTINTDIGRNTAAAELTFRDGQKILTDQLQKTSLLWSPRVGFNWDVKGDKSTQLRGGTGVFTGRVPYVWISNQASNNGLLFGSQSFNQAGATTAEITFQDDIDYYRPGRNGNPPITTGPPTYNLAVTQKNFKFAQVWRTNIAVDQRLPGGVIASFDFAYTKDINAVYHQNINLPKSTVNATGVDNRPIFYPVSTFPNTGSNSTNNSRINPTVTDAILMTNTSKPYSYFATAQFRKAFGPSLDVMAAYTYTQSRTVNDGGSIAQSVWRDRAISGDPNANVLAPSNYLKPHRIIASVNYRKEYAGFMATTIGAFYEVSQTGIASNIIGSRFSYVYSGDMNGDNAGGNNDLIYIPKQQSDIALTDILNTDLTVAYSAADQWRDLDNYIKQDAYLSKHRGSVAERNGGIYPWRGQLDLRILQDFYVNTGTKRNTIQISIDIFNVGNLVNPEWGAYKTYNRNNLITFKGYGADGTPQFQFPYLNAATKTVLKESFRDDLTAISRWQMQFGVRYIFN